jgi:MFS family permease
LQGIVTIAQVAMHHRSQLIALRLLLGVFEAGFVPTSYYYMSTLYPRYMAGFRLGLFAGMYAWGAAFSGLIAYGCLQVNSSKYRDWQVLFLVEGGVTLFFAVVTLLVIPKKLSTAWMLSPAEREHAVARIQRDLRDVQEAAGDDYVDDDGKIRLSNVKDAFKDWRKLLIIVFNICATTPVYSFTIFMPLIMRGFGYKGVDANLMGVSPFVVYGSPQANLYHWPELTAPVPLSASTSSSGPQTTSTSVRSSSPAVCSSVSSE